MRRSAKTNPPPAAPPRLAGLQAGLAGAAITRRWTARWPERLDGELARLITNCCTAAEPKNEDVKEVP